MKLFRQVKFASVFYFMTETSAAIFGIYFRIRGVKQVLWYAHAHLPLRLRLASLFMNSICSSTEGSMPIKNHKVAFLGQMVDAKLFTYSPKPILNEMSLVHYGRFDESKNIKTLIKVARNIEKRRPFSTLTLIGSPTNLEALKYQKAVLEEFEQEITRGVIKVLPACKRSELPMLLMDFNIFVHAFQGSLDKSLVEATLIGIPAVTINGEYLSEFGTWSGKKPNDFSAPEEFLEYELEHVMSLEKTILFKELAYRFQIAISKHSLDNWLRKINQVLIGN